MTTFKSREPIRKALVALFAAEGSWKLVFGYIPRGDEIKSNTPFLFITSAGTQQTMSGKFLNPATYSFNIMSAVLMADQAGNWTESDAEDKVDELDQTVRQVIRDNTGSLGTELVMVMEDTPSQLIPMYFGSEKYWIEQRKVDVTDLGS
jgi:hypothetical protein